MFITLVYQVRFILFLFCDLNFFTLYMSRMPHNRIKYIIYCCIIKYCRWPFQSDVWHMELKVYLDFSANSSRLRLCKCQSHLGKDYYWTVSQSWPLTAVQILKVFVAKDLWGTEIMASNVGRVAIQMPKSCGAKDH